MIKFSASDAALEGFRITRENPRAFAWWTVASFVVSLVGVFITVFMPADVRQALDALGSDTDLDGRTLLDAFLTASPLFLFGLALQCMMAAAVYRVIFRHDDSRYGYLRMGRDELRLMLLTIVMAAFAILLVASAVFASALVAAVASFAGSGAAVMAGSAGLLFFTGLVIYVLVRLSLAPPATFAERRLQIAESWRLTRGSFWPLLGAYALAMICVLLMGIVALVLFLSLAGIVTLAAGGQLSDLSAVFNPDDTSLVAMLHPAQLAYMVVGSIFQALYQAVMAAPGAVVYRGLHDHPNEVFRVHEAAR